MVNIMIYYTNYGGKAARYEGRWGRRHIIIWRLEGVLQN